MDKVYEYCYALTLSYKSLNRMCIVNFFLSSKVLELVTTLLGLTT